MTIVNRAELAEFFGFSVVTIDNYRKKGMPALERPDLAAGIKEYKFETAACVNWRIANEAGEGFKDPYKLSLQREKAAQAGLRELELAEKQAIMVSILDVPPIVEEQLGIVKSRINAMPARLCQACALESDPEVVRKLIEAEIYEALAAISNAP